MNRDGKDEKKNPLPYGLKDLKPGSQVDEHKLTAFQSAPAKKNAFEKAKERAQRKADREAAETKAVLEDFEAEYSAETKHSFDRAASPLPSRSVQSHQDQQRKRQREQNTKGQPWGDQIDSDEEERERARRRQKSGSTFLNELKSNNQRRERYDNSGTKKSEDVSKADLRPTVLHLSSLSPDTSQSKLLELLTPFGEVKYINFLPATTNDTFKHGVTAVCCFQAPEAADAAKSALDGRYIGEGFRIAVKFGKDSSALSTSAADPEEWAFGAQPKIINLSRVAPPSALQGRQVQRTGQALEIHVQRPSALATLKRIHGTIQQILIHGPPFEALLRHTQASNPDFEFLFDQSCESAQYFRYMLYLTYQNSTIDSMRSEINLFDTNTLWFPPQRQASEDDEESDDGDYQNAAKKPTGTSEPLGQSSRIHLWYMLRSISSQKKAIARVMAFAMTHASSGEEIAEIMTTSVTSSGDWKTCIARLWAISDILHNTSLPITNVWRYRGFFESRLPSVFEKLQDVGERIESRIRRENFKRLVLVLLDLWSGWVCFGEGSVELFRTNFTKTMRTASHDDTPADDAVTNSPTDADIPGTKIPDIESFLGVENKLYDEALAGDESIDGVFFDLDGFLGIPEGPINPDDYPDFDPDTIQFLSDPEDFENESQAESDSEAIPTLETAAVAQAPVEVPAETPKAEENASAMPGIMPKIKLSFGSKAKTPYKPKYEAIPARPAPEEAKEATPVSTEQKRTDDLQKVEEPFAAQPQRTFNDRRHQFEEEELRSQRNDLKGYEDLMRESKYENHAQARNARDYRHHEYDHRDRDRDRNTRTYQNDDGQRDGRYRDEYHSHQPSYHGRQDRNMYRDRDEYNNHDRSRNYDRDRDRESYQQVDERLEHRRAQYREPERVNQDKSSFQHEQEATPLESQHHEGVQTTSKSRNGSLEKASSGISKRRSAADFMD